MNTLPLKVERVSIAVARGIVRNNKKIGIVCNSCKDNMILAESIKSLGCSIEVFKETTDCGEFHISGVCSNSNL